MSRQTSKTRAPRKRRTASAPASTPETRTTLDPALEAQTKQVVGRFVVRMALVFVLVGVVSSWGAVLTHARGFTAQIIPILAAVGVMLPFQRGLYRLAQQFKQLGREKVAQHRYADARFVLDYFHRFGTMSLDMDGEAHYYLTLACIGLGDLDRARQMADWLQKYRRTRGKWAEKAESAVAAAERAQARRQQKEAETAGETP
jgi:hypothetical protein